MKLEGTKLTCSYVRDLEVVFHGSKCARSMYATRPCRDVVAWHQPVLQMRLGCLQRERGKMKAGIISFLALHHLHHRGDVNQIPVFSTKRLADTKITASFCTLRKVARNFRNASIAAISKFVKMTSDSAPGIRYLTAESRRL